MKKRRLLEILLLAALVFASCSKKEETDTEKPVIDMQTANAFPKPCDTLFRGENFEFRANFSDNIELGSFNLELHHNFDHHTHGSHQETCPVHPDKEPVNPLYFNQNFEIPGGSSTFGAVESIEIPADVDPGDYHFMVKLTDKEGWQSWLSVSVKIVE
jgi:hypothetical protein